MNTAGLAMLMAFALNNPFCKIVDLHNQVSITLNCHQVVWLINDSGIPRPIVQEGRRSQ